MSEDIRVAVVTEALTTDDSLGDLTVAQMQKVVKVVVAALDKVEPQMDSFKVKWTKAVPPATAAIVPIEHA